MLEALGRIELVLADPHHARDEASEPPFVDRTRSAGRREELLRKYTSLQPHGQVDFLGSGEERGLADLLHVDAGEIDDRLLHELVDLAARPRSLQSSGRWFNDADAVFAQLPLGLDEELPDLSGSEPQVRDGLGQFLWVDEASFASECGEGGDSGGEPGLLRLRCRARFALWHSRRFLSSPDCLTSLLDPIGDESNER